MQKNVKRLLSVLAVLALVLTMAPAGILAVETKAAAGDANLPEGVAELMAAGQAKQAAAVAALEQLTGATIDERCAELKAILPVCPFCGKTVAAWLATLVAAVVAAIEMAIAGTFPLTVGIASMALYHAFIGIIEGVLTVIVIYALEKFRPDLLAWNRE